MLIELLQDLLALWTIDNLRAVSSANSIILSWVQISLSLQFLVYLTPDVVRVLHQDPEHRTYSGYWSLALFTHFTGSLLDALWWHNAWSADISYGRHHPVTLFWFDNGPISNLLFRQGGTLWALYFHIKAYSIPQTTMTQRVATLATGLGILWIALLYG